VSKESSPAAGDFEVAPKYLRELCVTNVPAMRRFALVVVCALLARLGAAAGSPQAQQRGGRSPAAKRGPHWSDCGSFQPTPRDRSRTGQLHRDRVARRGHARVELAGDGHLPQTLPRPERSTADVALGGVVGVPSDLSRMPHARHRRLHAHHRHAAEPDGQCATVYLSATTLGC
jgi:hypothetical protein